MSHHRPQLLLPTLLLVGLQFLPAGLWAQAPTFVRQWGGSGSGPGQFAEPAGVAVDPSGFVYVADQITNRIQKFTSDGAFVTQWVIGPFAFPGPYGIASDSHGDLYVTDPGSRTIRKFTGTGLLLSTFGLVGPGLRPGAPEVTQPGGVALDASDNVYVTDGLGQRLQKFTASGSLISQWSLAGSNPLDNPAGVAADGFGSVYVADKGNHRIVRFSEDGVFLGDWQGGLNGTFQQVEGVASDRRGNIYTTEIGVPYQVQLFTGDGAFIASWGSSGSGISQFDRPMAVAADTRGNVYVSDRGNDRIQKFGYAPTPAFTTSWGRVKFLFR